MVITKQSVLEELQRVGVPGRASTLLESRLLAALDVEADPVRVVLEADTDELDCPALEALVRERLAPLLGSAGLSVTWKPTVPSRPVAEDDIVPGAKNVILVMSGKGGVGKSTVATNLALALQREGHRVGLLDADIYGPSIPTMLGVKGRPGAEGDKIRPLTRFGMKLMSIGFLLDDPHSAVVWRGPMLHSALTQFLKDVLWGSLDFLVLDLPPGTGDVALTLSQQVRATGAIVVTTPQEVALQDVYKSVAMARKVGIPLLGVVENESYFICDSCDKRHEIFGAGGGAKAASAAQAPLLGRLPIDAAIRHWGDAGTPIVQAAPKSAPARAFRELAQKLLETIDNKSLQPTVKIDRSGGVNRHLPVTR